MQAQEQSGEPGRGKPGFVLIRRLLTLRYKKEPGLRREMQVRAVREKQRDGRLIRLLHVCRVLYAGCFCAVALFSSIFG